MRRTTVGLMAVLALGACETGDPTLPSTEEAAEFYAAVSDLSVEVKGNVAEVTVVQSSGQLRRGGRLWARVGPYIYLFSQATQDLFTAYEGLAAVRVVTVSSGGDEVARATLNRGGLNELTWRRALNISGLARRDGTKQLTLLEDLVEWGEDHTEFEYSSRYAR